MNALDRRTFKAPNGDKLDDLNTQKEEAQKLYLAARDKLWEAERALQPLREEVSRHEGKVMNLSCRLNIWWNAYREQGNSPGVKPIPRRPILIVDY